MSENQEVQEPVPVPPVVPEKKLGLKSWLLISIAGVAILAFVADTAVKVYQGQPINTELLQSVLETLFKLVSSSDSE